VNPQAAWKAVKAALWRLGTAASRDVGRALYMVYICRVSLLLCGAVFGLAFVDQVQEVVRVDLLDAMTEQRGRAATVHLWVDYLLLVLLCWSTLFWSHYALASRFPAALVRGLGLRALHAGLPSVLALLPFAGAALALRSAARGLPQPAAQLALVLSLLCVALGLGCVAYFYYSRHRLGVDEGPAGVRVRSARHATIHRGVLTVSVMLALLAFIWVAVDAQSYGRLLGTVGVLLSACLGMQPTLTWLTTSPNLPRWHALTALAALAFVFSLANWNDNHVIRTLAGQAQPRAFNLELHAWLKARAPADRRQPIPVVLVAAEGGGVRAAYFTAQVLASLQDRCPALARHLLAISGVSGGSVGAAVFTGLLQAARVAPGETACDVPGSGRLPAQVDAVLGEDFIAPLAASLLFTDGAQRLLPFAVPAWDRARTLEISLERAFEAVAGTGFLQGSLYGYWAPQGNLPLLWFQTTSVGSGERVTASPVLFIDEKFNDLKALPDVQFSGNLRISTAAFLSARFPLVTPAATLPVAPPVRLVDGGYFENSGAATLAEALVVLQQVAQQAQVEVRPILIRIGNTPSVEGASSGAQASARVAAAEPLGLGESLSPVRAVLQARVARGDLSVRALRTQVAGQLERGLPVTLVEFQIGLSPVSIPLGWQLSTAARAEMRQQLRLRPGKDCSVTRGFENDCAVGAVVYALREALAPPAALPPADTLPAANRQPDAPVR
jgi:hypothetical protein